MSGMIRITAAQALRPYWLRLTFSDGAVKEVDLGDTFSQGLVFAPMRDDPRVFPQVRVNPVSGTIEWPGEVDFDPDVLYGRFEPASGNKLERRTIREPIRAAC
jgi:Protein of unknown function (DUF2442)